MGFYQNLIKLIPEVQRPQQKYLSFKQKLTWTITILLSFFILGAIPLFGLDPNFQFKFEQLSIILAQKFGTIITLGIGPIVTASIVLQLLNGAKIINFDLRSTEGRKTFEGTQKLLALFFVLFEACIYVFMGGIAPPQTLQGTSYFMYELILIAQLILGGILIMLMDDVVGKWGFGSGLSLFIVAGVAEEILTQAFSPLDASGHWALGTSQIPIGQVWSFFIYISQSQMTNAILAAAAIIATIVVFAMSVYGQAMKIEIPLSFGRVRGQGMRWPLKFMYASNIPVILVAALIANVQLFAQLFESWSIRSGNSIVTFISVHLLGQVNTATAGGGIMQFLQAPNIVGNLLTGTFTSTMLIQSLGYIIMMCAGAVLFSVLWVQTSGMDARAQANQIISSGLQIPGFRKDPRILEQILKRYINPLTVLGGLAVGVLAATADLSGALSRGTGILLAVTIIYKMYEDIAKQHMMDMHPMMRKFME